MLPAFCLPTPVRVFFRVRKGPSWPAMPQDVKRVMLLARLASEPRRDAPPAPMTTFFFPTKVVVFPAVPRGRSSRQAREVAFPCIDKRCASCDDTGTSCRQCRSPNVLFVDDKLGGTCVSVCPLGYHADVTKCSHCPAECSSCTDANHCLACTPPWLLSNKHCVGECPSGSVADGSVCRDCHASCNACRGLGPANCTRCVEGQFLSENHACVSSCADGFYAASGKCLRCDMTCDSCNGYGPGRCTRCHSGQVLHASRCLSSCPRGMFRSGDSCGLCHASCTNCTGSSPVDCLSCSDPDQALHNGQCVEDCPNKFFKNKQVCSPCHPACKHCSGPSDKECSACLPGYSLDKASSSCKTICKDGFFKNVKDGTCAPCSPTCASCVKTRDRCVSCPPGKLWFNNRCVVQCPNGSFLTPKNRCVSCHSTCSKCSGLGASACTACMPPLLLLGSSCVASCPARHTALTGLCVACQDSSCRACSSAAYCTACSAPRHLLFNGTCTGACPRRRFPDAFNNCAECDASCENCTTVGPGRCTSCLGSLVLSNGACVKTCSSGFFKDERSVCRPCSSLCADCENDASLCTRCLPGQALTSSKLCVSTCPERTVMNHTLQRCAACPAHCASCLSESLCTRCEFPLLLHAGRCVESCPASFYTNEDSSACAPCDKSCATCRGNRLQCITCRSGLALVNGACVAHCQAGTFLNSITGSCDRCHVTCKGCHGSKAGACVACNAPLYLLQSGNRSSCVKTCPQGFFSNKMAASCQPCHPTCALCSAAGPQACTQCRHGKKLTQSRCVAGCADGQYTDNALGRCQRCNETCATCVAAHVCTSCLATHRLNSVDGQCYPCCTGHFGEAPCCSCKENDRNCDIPSRSACTTTNCWRSSQHQGKEGKLSRKFWKQANRTSSRRVCGGGGGVRSFYSGGAGVCRSSVRQRAEARLQATAQRRK